MPRTTIAGHPRAHTKRIQKTRDHDQFMKPKVDIKAIKAMFKKTTIKRIAKDTDFVQRERKLDAYDFFCL